METTLHRRPVDVAPQRPHPALALVLALLSLPGSTIAWDLPAGGLWIGLPLGVAAIVVGIRSQRRPSGRLSGMAIAGIALAGLALASMVVWTISSAVS